MTSGAGSARPPQGVSKGWLRDLVVGGLIGGLVGVIAALNFVIYSGVDQGYEASLVEVFQYNVVAGVVTVMILAAGPTLGVFVARRLRRKRDAGANSETRVA